MAYRQTWDLDSLFQSEEQLAHAVVDFSAQIEDVAARTAGLTKDDLDAWCDLLASRDQLARQNYQVFDYVLCRTAANVADGEAWRWQERLNSLGARQNAARVRLHECIRQMPEEQWERLLADRRVRPIAYPLRLIRADMTDQLPADLQELVTVLAPDGFEAWGDLYQQVIGRIRVDFRGERLSVGQVTGRMADPDRGARAELFQATNAALEQEAEVCAAALNHMAGFRLALYRRRGFDSVLTEALRANHISQPTLDAMWAAAATATPRLKAYLERKALLLGGGGFHWYDETAPLGAAAAMPYDEAAALIIREFGRFSPGMGDLAARAFHEGWIEAENRPGKRPGGFCTVFPQQEQSRIFLTYGGGVMGPTAVAHELGHAYHYHVGQGLPMIVREAPMTLAETASTFAEALVNRAQIAGAESREARLALLDRRLQATVGYLPGIRARFLFELRFHEARRRGPLSVAQLNEMMAEAQQEAFGGALASYHPLYWMTKVHYFMATPFYNFPYTVGYLLSAGLFTRVDEPGFYLAFKLFLRDTGRDTVEEIARRHLGVDLTQPDFWQQAVSLLLQDVDEFLKLTK